jgi:hypothetical protein
MNRPDSEAAVPSAQHEAGPRGRARPILISVAAGGVLVSGYIHFYLYFEGGYRGIAPENFAGITISRAFALNAITGLVLAELLVASLIWPRLSLLAILGGIGFAATTLVAYGLTRTTGFLGFKDNHTITEAVIAVIAETATLIALTSSLAIQSRRSAKPR